MGRRARNAIPLKRIRVIIGNEMVTFELDSSERLEDRRAAKALMKALKKKADDIVQGVGVPPPRAVEGVSAANPPSLSIHHITLLALEEMDRKNDSFASSCISLIGGQLTEVF